MQCNPPTTDHYNFDLVTTDTYEVLQNNLTDEDTTDLHHYLQQTGHPEPEFVHQAVDEQPEPPTQQQATTTTRYHTQPTPTTWLDHSLTNYSRAYNTTSPPPRTDDGRQWNKSYEHMTTTNSSSGRSTQAPPTWQPRWERKAMWSSPLTWPMDGTSQKDSTEETSTVSTTVPPRTLSGWHHHARSGAHYNTSPSAQQHRQKHYKPQETTRNIHTWNLQATYTDDRCSTTGIASLNNPSPQQLGTHQHSKTHQATIAKLTNVNMEPHYPTTKETNSSSGSQPLCGPVILGWPKPWGGSVMMHTSTFPLKAHHQKSVSDRQQREHTTQQCVQHGLTSSTTSCRITTTTRNRDSNWMMKMMTTPLTTLTTMRQNNHNMTNNYKPCHSTTNTYNQHSNQCQTRAFSLDCRNRASKQQKEQYNDSTATLGIPPTRSLSSCSHNAEQATAYCKQHMTTSVTYAQCSNHHHRSPRAPWDTVERCSMNASWLTRCGSTSPGIVPQQPEEFPSLQSSTPPPSSWQPESSQWRSPRTFWKRWSEDGSGTLGLQPSSRSMTTEPGAVSSSEAGALITVSTLRSLQAKHTPDLASWKDVTKFYDKPSSSSWHKATSLSPQTTSSRRWRMWFHRSTMPRTCKGSQPPNGHLAMSHDCQATSWMRISCPPISHQVMRWCTNSSSSNRLLQPSAKPTSMPDSDGPYAHLPHWPTSLLLAWCTCWCRTKNPMEGPSNHCHGWAGTRRPCQQHLLARSRYHLDPSLSRASTTSSQHTNGHHHQLLYYHYHTSTTSPGQHSQPQHHTLPWPPQKQQTQTHWSHHRGWIGGRPTTNCCRPHGFSTDTRLLGRLWWWIDVDSRPRRASFFSFLPDFWCHRTSDDLFATTSHNTSTTTATPTSLYTQRWVDRLHSCQQSATIHLDRQHNLHCPYGPPTPTATQHNFIPYKHQPRNTTYDNNTTNTTGNGHTGHTGSRKWSGRRRWYRVLGQFVGTSDWVWHQYGSNTWAQSTTGGPISVNHLHIWHRADARARSTSSATSNPGASNTRAPTATLPTTTAGWDIQPATSQSWQTRDPITIPTTPRSRHLWTQPWNICKREHTPTQAQHTIPTSHGTHWGRCRWADPHHSRGQCVATIQYPSTGMEGRRWLDPTWRNTEWVADQEWLADSQTLPAPNQQVPPSTDRCPLPHSTWVPGQGQGHQTTRTHYPRPMEGKTG